MESKTGNIFFERIFVFGNESFFSEYASGFRFGFNGKEKMELQEKSGQKNWALSDMFKSGNN